MKRWAVRDAGDIRAWLGQVLTLPWAGAPFPITPTQEVVIVDRLTAERVALVLTGVPLPV